MNHITNKLYTKLYRVAWIMCLTVLAVGVVQICGCGKDNTISLSSLVTLFIYNLFAYATKWYNRFFNKKKHSVDPHPFKEIWRKGQCQHHHVHLTSSSLTHKAGIRRYLKGMSVKMMQIELIISIRKNCEKIAKLQVKQSKLVTDLKSPRIVIVAA